VHRLAIEHLIGLSTIVAGSPCAVESRGTGSEDRRRQ
jgi:hypothetical protein